MAHRKLNRIIALGMFLVSLTVYFLTMAPTVVFWDVGEFIAAADMMQVPHPPGAPLFLLLTRAAMMIPFASDAAVRAHSLTAVFSALSVMFLYLVTVRVLISYRGKPETTTDRAILYGSSIVGALALAFSTTFWGNSIEAEVYGASMFFLTLIMWLVMRWQDEAEALAGEKYLILIAYLIGLSLGVHLLALLTIFPVLMIVYFRRYEVSLKTFVIYGLVAVATFIVVYPGIVKYIPSMMDGEFRGVRSEWFKYLPWIAIAAIAYGTYATFKKRQHLAHVALLSILLIFVGYTTYTTVIIRSNAHPPMNENDPSDFARLTSYLSREQYGDAPLFFPRRYSREPHQQGMYRNYSSDWDFLFRYQLNHMFIRYLGWNFIGEAGDVQDSGVSWRHTMGIPFLVGLFGMFSLFRRDRDWRLGLVFLMMFIVLGPLLALYQNQQEPQPRERDYFYVGAFYIFSLWIAVGTASLAEMVKRWNSPAVFGVLGVALLVIPGRMLQMNWHERDRSNNYVAWDYSYNILQTCEQDAILFTNGDNDTFPLWYLQDVEGIRRDVRIVNLSLINTPWYIKQMKEEPYYEEAQAVPISLADSRIEGILPEPWEPRELTLPVPEEAMEAYGVTDSTVRGSGAITFLMPNTVQFGATKAIRVQDILVRDIIFTNRWQRPIYFAVTVAPDSKIGLDDFLWFRGLAWRLEPRKVPPGDLGISKAVLEANLLQEPDGLARTQSYGYKFRHVADPDVYFDENQARLMLNYRSAFIRLAMHYGNVERDTARAIATLDRMESLIPRSKVPLAWELQADIMSFYQRLGQQERFKELADEIEPRMKELIASGQVNLGSYYNPYRVLLEIYEIRKQYGASLELLRELAVMYPNDPNLQQRITMMEARARALQQSDSLPPQGNGG